MYISALLVLKEHHNVNYPVKKVSLCDILQLPRITTLVAATIAAGLMVIQCNPLLL